MDTSVFLEVLRAVVVKFKLLILEVELSEVGMVDLGIAKVFLGVLRAVVVTSDF